MKDYKYILWDWNGTIIDDVQVACSSVNDMLVKRDLPVITMEQYYSYIDTPIYKFYEHLFDLNVVTFDIIAKEFNAGYKKHLQQQPLMPGINLVLDAMGEKGKQQVIVSASNKNQLLDNARKYCVLGYFNKVLAFDNFTAESKVSMAEAFVREYKICPENTVVIGDTLHDYQMAQAVGCDCILTTQGHQSRKELSRANHAVILDDIVNVLEIIK